MNYRIAFTGAEPDMDGVSVAQLKNYPLEPEDYKPFAQFRLAASPEGLFVRMLAFEVVCDERSTLAFILAGEGWQLSAAAEHDGAFAAQTTEGSVKKLIHGEVRARFFTGEDLQGVYWGVDMFVPADVVPDFGELSEKGCRGNFFKLCRTGRRHFGSFFPYAFEGMAASDAPDTPDETLRLIAGGGNGMGEMPAVGI